MGRISRGVDELEAGSEHEYLEACNALGFSRVGEPAGFDSDIDDGVIAPLGGFFLEAQPRSAAAAQRRSR